MGLGKVLGFYGIMAVIAVLAMWRRDHLALCLPDGLLTDWAIAVGAGMAVGLSMVGASRLATGEFVWAERLAEEFRGIIGWLRGREVLAVALMSGIAEESLFRGVLQPALGLWLASAIFGVLHIGPNVRFLPWTVMAFAAGLAFGALLLWTGNLVAPMIAHVTVNYLNLRYLARIDQRDEVHLDPVGGEHVAGQ